MAGIRTTFDDTVRIIFGVHPSIDWVLGSNFFLRGGEISGPLGGGGSVGGGGGGGVKLLTRWQQQQQQLGRQLLKDVSFVERLKALWPETHDYTGCKRTCAVE